MPKKYYIAYGSNLNIRQMKYRCPGARVVGTAVLDGWQLLFKGSKTGSYLTIEENLGYMVPVAIWEISPEDERALDRYEGFPNFYYKKEIRIPVAEIRTGRTKLHDAFVYIMHEDRKLGVPTSFYMRTCLEGYRNFGFDTALLFDAYDKSL